MTCPDCAKTQEALDEAIIAIDGSVNALVMARIILERAVPKEPAVKKRKPPTASSENFTPGCAHASTFPIDTGGTSVLMCNDCGETLKG